MRESHVVQFLGVERLTLDRNHAVAVVHVHRIADLEEGAPLVVGLALPGMRDGIAKHRPRHIANNHFRGKRQLPPQVEQRQRRRRVRRAALDRAAVDHGRVAAEPVRTALHSSRPTEVC